MPPRFEKDRVNDRMDNDLTNPETAAERGVASGIRNVLRSSRYPFWSPVGFESGSQRGGRVIGLLAPLIPEYCQWFSADAREGATQSVARQFSWNFVDK